MLKFLKGLFTSSPADKAFKKCLACDHGLMTTAIAFQESFKYVGTELQPDESALDDLGGILQDAARGGASRVRKTLCCFCTQDIRTCHSRIFAICSCSK